MVAPSQYIAGIGAHTQIHPAPISVMSAHKIVRCPVTAMTVKPGPVEIVIAVAGQDADEMLERSHMSVTLMMVARPVAIVAMLVVVTAVPVGLMPAAIIVVTAMMMVVSAVMDECDSARCINC